MVSTPSAPPPQQIRQTSTAEPPGYVRPLIDKYMTRGEDLSNLPFAPLPTAAERLQGVDPSEALGYGNILTQAQGAQPGIAAANAAMLNQLNQTPGQNPYVDAMIQRAQGGIVDQFNTQVAPQIAGLSKGSGAFGNTGVQEADASSRYNLARALGDVDAGIRLPAYFAEIQAQQGAVPLAQSLAQDPYQRAQAQIGVGQAQRQFGQAGRDIGFQNLISERESPYRNLDILASTIAGASGGFGTTTASGPYFPPPQPNPFVQGLGAAGMGMGGMGTLMSAFG
jgi:hypothetical protein